MTTPIQTNVDVNNTFNKTVRNCGIKKQLPYISKFYNNYAIIRTSSTVNKVKN